MDKFIEDEIAAIKAASERELRQMNLLHNKKMEAKLATKKKLEMLAEQAKNSELLYTQQQSEQYINNIRQMAEENVEDLKKRMEDTASRMQEADKRMQEADKRMQEADKRMQEADKRMQESRERILAEETQDVDNEEDDEEWVDCEDIDYQGVNYSACEGSATANFIIDEDIRILRIPDKIKDEDGNEYVVDEFEIEDLYKVEHLHLPKTLKRVYGCALERNRKVNVRFLGLETPSVCFENGIFYSQDKKAIQNTKLADIGSEYTVKEGVEVIEIDAFENCKQLRVLNLPSTIKTINPAFNGCSALQVVNIYADSINVVFSNLNRDDEEVDVLPDNVQVNYLKPITKAKAPTVQKKTEKQKEETINTRRFALSSADKKIFGVCGGIANYFDINSSIVRIAVVILSLIFPVFFILVYFLLKLIMPNKDVMQEIVTDETKTNVTKDYSKYSVNGEGSYGKARMVEAVVNKYIELNPNITIDKLKRIFPNYLQGTVLIEDSADNIKDMKRFYESTLPNGTKFYISNQWGTQIDTFIKHVDCAIDDITVTKLQNK